MVDWFCKPKTDSLISLQAVTPPLEDRPPDVPSEPSFYLEPDRIAGLSSEPPTPEDELVAIFLSSMAGFIMKRCETEDCMKRIDLIKLPPQPPVVEESEEEDIIEDIIPESSKSTWDKKKSSAVKNTTFAKRRSKVAGKSGGPPAPKKVPENRKSVTNDEIAEEGSFQGTRTSIQRASRVSRIELEKTNVQEVEDAEEFENKQDAEESVEEDEGEEAQKIHRKRCWSMEEVDRKLCSWKFKELDQMVDIDFINNNSFKGRLSRMMMEEYGKFTWNNGQTYKGSFRRGFCDGYGLIEWNAHSIYEGQIECNLRNGTGVKTYVDLGKKMYHTGQWKQGKKHGKGKTVYEEGNWYDGDWVEGQKTGVGIRLYKNGTRYQGQWYKGMRHGKGTMIWPNNDVYTGEWNLGQMHGRGKYIWNSFMNNRLLTPLLNSYTGEWSQNKRHGEGVLELMSGGVVRTMWFNDEKFGTADIICRNGNLLHFKDLFTQDKVAPITRSQSLINKEKIAKRRRSVTSDRNFVKIRFHNDAVDKELKWSDTTSFERKDDNANLFGTPVVPINAPVHTMDFTPHINKLFEIKCTSLLPLGPNDPKPPVIPAWEKKAITWLESKWLEKVIIRRMGDLTKVYNFYCFILGELEMPPFKFCMHRLSLWLLLKHCGLSETCLNTVRLDEIVGLGHDPFDKIMMYEMINYLLELSWLRYVPKRIKNPDIPGVIAACFDKFIEEVVVYAPSKYDGSFHKFLKFTPFEALNTLYSTFDYPMLIEDLCSRLLYMDGKDFEDKLPFPPPYYKYILQGKNIVGPDGYLSYVPFEEPYFDLNKMKLHPEAITPADLRVLGIIGIPNVVRCIKEAVPEAINPYNDELDSEYELSFNEFCDILVNLVTVYLDMAEDYYRHLLDKDENNKTGAETAWMADEPNREGKKSTPEKPKNTIKKRMSRK